MANSSLTAERLRELLHYDTKTGEFRWKSSGRGRRLGRAAGSPLGGADGKKYLYVRVDGVSYYAHRLAWLYVKGEWPGAHIDHKEGDCDGIDNLRSANRSQNACNAKRRADNTSGFKGVKNTRRKLRKPWVAIVMIGQVTIHVGYFESAIDAAIAYDAAAIAHFGEFARTNKMLGLLP